MKRLRYLMVTSLLCIAGMLHADVLRELAERISPELAYRVRFSIDASETDITVAPGDGEVISITAPDTRLAAAGLGCYLRDVAQAHWSWCGNPTPTRPHLRARWRITTARFRIRWPFGVRKSGAQNWTVLRSMVLKCRSCKRAFPKCGN